MHHIIIGLLVDCLFCTIITHILPKYVDITIGIIKCKTLPCNVFAEPLDYMLMVLLFVLPEKHTNKGIEEIEQRVGV